MNEGPVTGARCRALLMAWKQRHRAVTRATEFFCFVTVEHLPIKPVFAFVLHAGLSATCASTGNAVPGLVNGKFVALSCADNKAFQLRASDDGIVSALQILQAVRRSDGTLDALLDALLEDVTRFPQTLINVPLRGGNDWKNSAALNDAQQTVLRALGDAGRVLIRASGTEQVLRVMVEARDGDLGKRCAERMAAAAAAG